MTMSANRIRTLATVSSIALVAAVPGIALAQDAPAEGDSEEQVDEAAENTIIVSGFRASLESAQNFKENADTFVDVITAEDIGALPDRSVAEALQRVPGVNIGRFEKVSDPDRFSVEGTGVIIRGLPYVRSELNGREIFSATGGRVLSFNDVSPELLGRVEVFKNVTADMVEGAIAGQVNLVTRKPLDNLGFNISGSIEMNYGDLREEWSPTFNILASNTFDTAIGTFGIQGAYSNSELNSRTDASQVSDPCYRNADLTGGCIRAQGVSSAGFDGAILGPDEFPPAGSVLVPSAAGVRTTDLDREREAYSVVAQYESVDGRFLLTAEYLRSDTTFATEEFALIGRPNERGNFTTPAAGSTWGFENGVFTNGVLTQTSVGGPLGVAESPYGGVPVDALRFLREADSVTEDYSIDVDFAVTDRLRFNFEGQRITSELSRDSVFGATSTWADIALDLREGTPQVEFVLPSETSPFLSPANAPSDYFGNPFYSYYWFALDSREQNEAELYTLRADVEYDIGDGFFKSARVGARWADRDRTTRNTDFSTWGNLSAPWAGRDGCLPWGEGPNCNPGGAGTIVYDWNGNGQLDGGDGYNGFTPGRFFNNARGRFPNSDIFIGEIGVTNAFDGASGGAYIDDFPAYARLRDPFGDGFQRGSAPTPIPGGEAFFFGGDDFLAEYLDGTTDEQVAEIQEFGQSPERFNYGVNGRSFTNALTGETTACNPYCPSEISIVAETTRAAYARVDFGHDFNNGWIVEGNFGLRYVETKISTQGQIGFPAPGRFDTPVLDNAGNPVAGGNGDGVVQVSEVVGACSPVTLPDGTVIPIGGGGPQGYCDLSDARLAEYAAAFTGEILNDDRDIVFDNWLPSFNVKLDTGDGLLFRAAVSRGISRPDLQLFRGGGGLGDNTDNLSNQGTLASGPLFSIRTGNRNLLPVESWNYDLSAEWYFDTVGSLTASLFLKDITGIVNTGIGLVNYTSPSGVSVDTQIEGPANDQSGQLKGIELAYQQTYDFLPGLLDGLGSQLTYTYVDGGDFSNPNLANPGEASVTTNFDELGGSPFAFLQPLAGISEHTVNATLFYERGPLAMRAAYNWRSEFLITPRDDIFPFSPIWQESSGQLDASIFYSITDQIKVGVQAVNLLDEVTETSQVVDYDGTRITRSAFRNDRRYTFIARFGF
ncbi:TonB-dependent receptor domain-containing protein [Aurantiacibacter marinus]|uniref:TonB-dependent receptor n=1 Tax=Aurantiacibacter marinus TaxID=874156 RepID=A0A0H0XSK4_9SPHN|nr:TonB-dependent receptor [Aurantiacibacter marinus]KLI65294.1 TonB-dependent receptor [Aurantiacibacter marinus]